MGFISYTNLSLYKTRSVLVLSPDKGWGILATLECSSVHACVKMAGDHSASVNVCVCIANVDRDPEVRQFPRIH